MVKNHTVEMAIKMIEDEFDKQSLAKLYDKAFIKYSGISIEGELTYQEMYAKFILDRLFVRNPFFILYTNYMLL